MEYKRSEDGGITWSEPYILEYSKHIYEIGRKEGKKYAVMCEKAVSPEDNLIVLFNLECDYTNGWHPHRIPTYLISKDGGYKWSEPKLLGDKPGRIYDALYHNGCIFVLEFCNDTARTFYGSLPEHTYLLYVSTDNGETFTLRSVLPFDTKGRAYGTMEILTDGSLIVYVYTINDEYHLDYVISKDMGYTWSKVNTSFFEKKIRNPQMTAFKNGFILHGRSGCYGDENGHFVLYTSKDGINWDSGIYLCRKKAGLGAYSNNVVVHSPETGKEVGVIIQASYAYEDHKTNILHWYLE